MVGAQSGATYRFGHLEPRATSMAPPSPQERAINQHFIGGLAGIVSR
jgi:hypothetical protein